MQRAYSIQEFGKIYGIGRTKIYEEIKGRRLKAVKLGAKTIIRADDAEAWLASLPASGHLSFTQENVAKEITADFLARDAE